MASGLAVTQDGSSVVVGSFREEITFGLGETNETVLQAPGSFGAFIAVYDSSGALLWARRVEKAGAVSVDTTAEGNILVSGSFTGTSTFGPGETMETTLVANGDNDGFIAEFLP